MISLITENDIILYAADYQCGSDGGWSQVYSFRSIRNGTDWSPRLLVYGDMGSVNARSLQQMTKEVLADRYDLVLHVGM